jgi:hypothetical protein
MFSVILWRSISCWGYVQQTILQRVGYVPRNWRVRWIPDSRAGYVHCYTCRVEQMKKSLCTDTSGKAKPSLAMEGEVLTAVVTKGTGLKVNRRFGGKCRLHLQCRRISRTRHQRENMWYSCLVYSWPWTSRHVSPKRRLTFNELHRVISQKIELSVLTCSGIGIGSILQK